MIIICPYARTKNSIVCFALTKFLIFFFCACFVESCDGMRRTSDLAMHSGYQRRTREIADWARSKRRRYIRREDLLAYLAGKSPPPSTMKHVTKLPQHLYATAPHQAQQHNDHHLHNGATFVSSSDSDLHTFKDALARRPRYVYTAHFIVIVVPQIICNQFN